MEKYPPAIEQKMKESYQTLSEKDRRRYAVIEASELGHGGIIYVSNILGCNRNTVTSGIIEIENQDIEAINNKRVRRPGGVRKNYDHDILITQLAIYAICRHRILKVTMKDDTAPDSAGSAKLFSISS